MEAKPCRDNRCVYQEPHNHGFACGPYCEYCLLLKMAAEKKK